MKILDHILRFADESAARAVLPDYCFQDAAWRAKVQMLVGGIYMDPTLSEDERWLCTIADPRDTMSAKFSEATAKLSGNDGEIYRCYYAARPCRANVQRGYR